MVEAEGSKPLNFSIEADSTLAPHLKDINVKTPADENAKTALIAVKTA
jgi:hypothetical protein